jgi:hypothetical protein
MHLLANIQQLVETSPDSTLKSYCLHDLESLKSTCETNRSIIHQMANILQKTILCIELFEQNKSPETIAKFINKDNKKILINLLNQLRSNQIN